MSKKSFNKLNTKKLIQLALLISLQIILTRFFSIQTPIVRIGFGFVPIAVIAMMYGPMSAGICAVIADLIGSTLFPSGPYFPGFTLTSFLTGYTYGLFLYNKEKTTKNIWLSNIVICIVLNLILDTVWLSILLGKGFLVLLPPRIIKTIILIPIQSITIKLVWDNIVTKLKYINK